MENSNTLIAGENKPQAKYNRNVSIIPMIRPILGSETNPIDDRQQQSSKSSQQSYSCNHDSSSQSICCPHQILFNAFSNHIIPFPYCIYNNINNNSSNSVINNKNSKQLDRSNQSKPLSSAAKRRIRRKRNQMKRFEAILTATAAATAVSILSHQKHYQQPLHIHHNLTNNQRKISKNNGYPLNNNNDDNKNISLSVSNKHLNNTNNNNTINHNDKQYSNNDPFYNCKNASSFKIKSCLRYVIFVSVSLKQVFL